MQLHFAEELQKAGKDSESVDHFEKAERIQPGVASADFGFAKALAAIDRSKEAIAVAERAIEEARKNRQEAIGERIENWLTHYRIELERSEDGNTRRDKVYICW